MINKLSERISMATKSRPKAESCELCKQSFNLMHKQHECKRCLRAICHYCGVDKTIISFVDPKVPHRTCKECREDQQAQKQLIEGLQCGFGMLSNVGKRWLKIINDNVDINQLQDSYYNLIPKLVKESSEEIKSQLQQNLLKIYKEVKNSMNYSLMDWHYISTKNVTESNVQTRLSNVLTAFYQTQQVKVTKNLVLITLFLLYFCDESVTLYILQTLHKSIIPLRFQYLKTDMDDKKPIDGQNEYLYQIYTDQYTYDPKNSANIRKFFEEFSTPMLTSLMINHLNFQVSYFLFNQLLVDKQFHQYEKLMAFICKKQLNYISELGFGDNALHIQIIKTVSQGSLTQFFSQEQIESSKRSSIQRQSITKKEESSSQIIVNSRTPMITEEDDPNGKLLETLLEVVVDGQSNKMDQLMTQYLKFEKSKLQFNELVGIIRNQRESIKQYRLLEFENQSKEYKQMKSNYEIQLQQAKEVQQIEQELNLNLNDESDNDNDSSLNQQSLIKMDDKIEEQIPQQIIVSRSESKIDLTEQFSDLQKEVSKLRIENNELQIQLQQSVLRVSVIEQQNKNQQQQAMEQQIQKLTQEKSALLLKVKNQQQQFNQQKQELNQKILEIEQQNQQITEIKSNSEELSKLCSQQNEFVDKLNKHIDQLKVQIQGLKRKQTENKIIETDKSQQIFETIDQLRNDVLSKERELYSLKYQFVGINQQKIKNADKISLLEYENKSLKSQMSQMEITHDVKKLNDYFEEKIDLLQQNHQDQMNRLLSQQVEIPQPPQEQIIQQEVQKENDDECSIF